MPDDNKWKIRNFRQLVQEGCKVWGKAIQENVKPVEYDYNRSRGGGYQADQNYPPIKAQSPITDTGPPPAPKPPPKKEEAKK